MAAKLPDRYYDVDPWCVTERGFDPERGRISESIFSLANEFMGTRGYFDEGFSGDRLQGVYFNNLYEEMQVEHPQYFKGLVTRVCFGVNSVDWLYTRIELGGELLDLAKVDFSDFERKLDMKTGTLTRSFVWNTAAGKQLKLTFKRFLSMRDPHQAFQQVIFEPLNFSGSVRVTSGLDYGVKHEIAEGWDQTEVGGADATQSGVSFWSCNRMEYKNGLVSVLGETENSGHLLYAGFMLESDAAIKPRFVREEKLAALTFNLRVRKGTATTVEKRVTTHWEQSRAQAGAWKRGMTCARKLSKQTFEKALASHCLFWAKEWKQIDIPIEGDDESLQGLRFSIFNLHQTYFGYDPGLNIPCKGLTAEVYYGNVFWDTETYCLPYYMFNNQKAARNLLLYRHKYLPQACERAEQMGLEGARYPMHTIDGTESCATWQHGDFEIHVSEAISYAVWHYMQVCDDRDFLYNTGVDILLQVSRFYASHGDYSPLNGDFGLYGVMGPDEYHTNINNNCYTNVMAKKTFEYSLVVMREMKKAAPKKWAAAVKRNKLRDDEPRNWRRMANKMRIPYDAERDLYEQHDGYFDLPEVDVKNIPQADIPIYKSWPYVKIFRYNMIKQPDFLLLPLFFSNDYEIETKRKNYEFYEARTIHESSLSPGVHSILASELGKKQEAWDFFQYMVRLDLDNYNRNVEQGLHVTSMSGAWLNMVYGFGGLRTDGKRLAFAPSIPKKWKSYSFRLKYQGAVLSVTVTQKNATFKLVEGERLRVDIYGKTTTIGANEKQLPIV